MLKLQQSYHHIQTCWYNLSHFYRFRECWCNAPYFCRHLLCNLIVGMVIAVALIPVEHTDTYRWLEDVVGIDWVMKMFRGTIPTNEKSPSFVILDIDESTYQKWEEPLITPRDKLLKLIETAVNGKAKIVMVDIDLSYHTDRSQKSLEHPNNQADKKLYEYIKEYDQNCTQSGKNCPYIFLARNSRLSSDSKQLYREQSQSFLDPVVAQSKHVYWTSTLFGLESDQVMRRWHLWQVTCKKEVVDVLPSMHKLAEIVMLKSTTPGQAHIKFSVRK